MTTRRINATTVTRSRPLAAAGSGADSRGVSANIAGSLCRAPVPVQRSADARAHEVTDDRDGALGLVQHRQEPVPDVDHRRPLLDRDVNTRHAGPRGEAARVAEPPLFAPLLDQPRWT